ncbi:MCE family protein [Mycobacterium sp. DL440]|uniref:MCE family protein n=1 Tax=Mycobacterium sp. DL440 TaxID=2675523 RepID=UPI00141E74BD|nr:MCE family protein [Mycobacterium sp. DL440]
MRILAATLLAAVLVGSAVVVVTRAAVRHTMIAAVFASATGIYPGDDVRVAGVKVGTIKSITPSGDHANFTLDIDRGVPIPADVKAVVVASNLISARYVQLTPGYEDSGPTLADGSTIPLERTAVPVEWDEVKAQLTRLASDLGPHGGVDGTSMGRFIESTANAMEGNGDKLRQTLAQLSTLGRVLGAGSSNIVDTVKNLQIFVTALRDSNAQIVQFEDRFATLTSVVNNSRTDLDNALAYLSEALGEVRQFVADTRDKTSEQIQRLSRITQTLSDQRIDVANILHVAPNAFSNAYKIFHPDNGANVGAFVMNNFSNPVGLLCSSIGAVENATAPETAKLCAQYLGPALRLLNFNHLPFSVAPYLMKSPSPDRIIYSEPGLAPGGGGVGEPEPEAAPAVSAYTGVGDVPPPAGWEQLVAPPGILAPNGLPANPSPALLPAGPPAAEPGSSEDTVNGVPSP